MEENIDKELENVEEEESGNHPDLNVIIPVVLAVGIILLFVGVEIEKRWVVYAALATIPIALFYGAFRMKEEDSIVRLGMLIAGGLFLAQI